MITITTIPAPVRQGADRFWRWWTGELAACLPARIGEKLARGRARLVVEISDSKAIFSQGRGKILRRLGAVRLNSSEADGAGDVEQRQAVERIVSRDAHSAREVVLRLPRDKVLRRLVELPSAAGENLREVLGFEMDRHTPFKAQEVYYDFRIKGTDAQRKRISVDLVVIPRAVVDKVVAQASAWGLNLDLLEVAGGAEGDEQVFDLLPRGSRGGRGRFRRRIYFAVGAASAAMLFLAVYLPLEAKREILLERQADLARAQAAAERVNVIRTQIKDLIARSRFVIEQKGRQRSVTELLDEVTRRLPDHTWALRFGIRKNLLTVSGYSAKPSALIGLLEESEMLSGVRFSSPVTMDQKVGLERFNLTASVTQRAP